MQACQTITNNICPDINAALLPVSGLEDAMRIVLCPLVVAVKIDAISTKTCLIWGGGLTKERGAHTLLNKSPAQSLSWRTVSRLETLNLP
jgi:hypothetical protein